MHSYEVISDKRKCSTLWCAVMKSKVIKYFSRRQFFYSYDLVGSRYPFLNYSKLTKVGVFLCCLKHTSYSGARSQDRIRQKNKNWTAYYHISLAYGIGIVFTRVYFLSEIKIFFLKFFSLHLCFIQEKPFGNEST